MPKKLTESLNEGRERFVEILNDNKEQWIVGETDPINGKTPVRLCYETRNDNAIPTMTVLLTDIKPEKITADDVADMVYDNVVIKNQSMSIPINALMDNVRGGKSVVNSEMMDAVLSFASPLKTYKDKVLNNPRIMAFTMECELVDRGYDPNKLFGLNETFLQLGRKAVLLNTDENGQCPLMTTKNIVDNILTTRFREKMEKESETYISMLDKIEEAKPSEPTRKSQKRLKM